MGFISNIISCLRVATAAATHCVKQYTYSMLETFWYWACVLLKFVSLKSFTPIPITFWEPYLIYGISVAFWLESFTETQLGQSIFWRPNGIIFKTCFISKYLFESIFQNNLNFWYWTSNEKFMVKILTGCQADILGTELGQ